MRRVCVLTNNILSMTEKAASADGSCSSSEQAAQLPFMKKTQRTHVNPMIRKASLEIPTPGTWRLEATS